MLELSQETEGPRTFHKLKKKKRGGGELEELLREVGLLYGQRRTITPLPEANLRQPQRLLPGFHNAASKYPYHRRQSD